MNNASLNKLLLFAIVLLSLSAGGGGSERQRWLHKLSHCELLNHPWRRGKNSYNDGAVDAVMV